MEKRNLVEELRKLSKVSKNYRAFMLNGECFYIPENKADYLADRIEAEFVPRPRYEDGTVVQEGDATRYGTVSFYEVDQNGDFTVHYEEGGDCSEYTQSQRVEKATVALDADGVPCKPGDTVYCILRDHPHYAKAYTVKSVAEGGRLVMEGEPFFHRAPNEYSHEKPDTMEAIEEDARKDVYYYWGCGDKSCDECPATKDGKTPSQRYGVVSCALAMWRDLFYRAMNLKK